jgi:hypothetical protein
MAALLGLLLMAPAVRTNAQATFVGTSSNTGGDSLYMSLAFGNGNANRLVFATPVYNPNDVFEDHPIGVWYDGAQWAVFNQDGSAMPLGAAFNEYDAKASNNVFLQRTNKANTSGIVTYINHATTNKKPSLKLFVTPNWDPGDVLAGFNDHNIGIWYDTSLGEWSIFNEDFADMNLGLAFNVIAVPAKAGVVITHTTNKSTIVGNISYIPEITHDPNAILMITQTYGPHGVYDDCATGVWFDSFIGQWAIFNQDGSPMPAGATFNVWWTNKP